MCQYTNIHDTGYTHEDFVRKEDLYAPAPNKEASFIPIAQARGLLTRGDNSLDKLRGPRTVRFVCLPLLIAVLATLLVTPSVSFAKSGAGTQPTAVTAIFVAISQHLNGKPMYPH